MGESQNVWHCKREESIHLDGNPEDIHLLEILPRPSSTCLCVRSTGVPLKQAPLAEVWVQRTLRDASLAKCIL